MEKPKKKITEKEFIKLYLKDFNRISMCNFCKYNPDNYENMDETLARINRSNKCMNCEHLPQNKQFRERIEKKRKLFNNFKPLYRWENIEE